MNTHIQDCIIEKVTIEYKVEGILADRFIKFNFNDDSFRNVLNAIINFVGLNYENITGICLFYRLLPLTDRNNVASGKKPCQIGVRKSVFRRVLQSPRRLFTITKRFTHNMYFPYDNFPYHEF